MVTCDEAVATLNDEESGAKQRERALAALAELALSDSAAVFSSIQQLDRAFKAVLIDREEGKKKYGTSLGRMHEMMLIVLIRATNYGLSTSQLLEFVGGDVALALAIVQSILKVPAYEDELFAAVVQLLHGFLLPQTYAPAGGSALELQIEDFSSHVVAFPRALLKAKMLLQLPGQLAQRLFPASEGVVPTSAWPVARVVAALISLRLRCASQSASRGGGDGTLRRAPRLRPRRRAALQSAPACAQTTSRTSAPPRPRRGAARRGRSAAGGCAARRGRGARAGSSSRTPGSPPPSTRG